MMKHRITTIALAAGLTLGVSGQEPAALMSLSLEQAIGYALDHNKNLQNARREVVKSDKAVWERISQGLPQVDGSLDYTTYFNYELTFDFGGGESMTPTQQQINDALTQTQQAFPGFDMTDAQDVFAAQMFESQLNEAMPASTILMSDESTASLRVSQLIFSGQYIVGIHTAKLAKKISNMALQSSETDTKEAVVNAYYLVLINERSLDILEKNLANINETLEQTRKMYETGMAEKTDVDQLRITVSQLENSMRSMERNLEMNYNMLRFTLGMEASDEIELTESLEELYLAMEPGSLIESSFSPEQHVNYKILRSQAEISKKLWNMEKWNFGPTITGFYSYNEKLKTTGFDMNPNHLAGLSLSLPIFSSGQRKVKMDQARITYEQSRTDAEILGDQLELQNRQLKYNLQSSVENYQTQKENVEVAEEVLMNYKRKFEQGMASSMELTQANSNYLDAQSNYLNAMFELMNAQIQLQKLLTNLENL